MWGRRKAEPQESLGRVFQKEPSKKAEPQERSEKAFWNPIQQTQHLLLVEPQAKKPCRLIIQLYPSSCPYSKILMEIVGKQYMRRPNPLKTFTFQNKDKYRCFHHDYNHGMNECHQLKKEIQNLIQHGYLGKYVCGGITPSDSPNPGELPPLPKISNQLTKNEVGMISLGAGRPSKKPREEVREK